MNLRPATVSDRQAELIDIARSVKGFMPDDEGLALLAAAEQASLAVDGEACIVEIGAWCGKSATYLGAGAEAGGAVVFSLDHHHGSEENQAGWDHFDSAASPWPVLNNAWWESSVTPASWVLIGARP